MSDAQVKDLPKQDEKLQSEVTGFSSQQLKHVEPVEKVVLPSKEEIQQEKGQAQLRSGIENFDSKALKQTETQVKNQLPTKEVIEQEKNA